MYSRAKRDVSKVESQTIATVGPGSYHQKPAARYINEAYAPFGSLRSRQTIFSEPAADERPGPNAYEPKLSAKQGPSLSSRSARFKGYETPVPAPGSYSWEKPMGWRKHDTSYAINARPKASTRVQYARQQTASSIPARPEIYGYEVDKSGGLIKSKPPLTTGTELGPGCYDISQADVQQMKGARWSTRSEPRRLQQAIQSGPSPVDYQQPSSVREDEHPLPKPNVPFTSTSRRDVTEAPRRVSGKEATPASYQLPTDFNYQPTNKHFLSTSRRFKEADTVAPAPGVYNPPSSSLKQQQRYPFVRDVPFLQSSARFQDTTRASSEVPAPNNYNLTTTTAATTRQAPSRNNSHIPTASFNSSDRRTQSLIKADAFVIPGPGEHHPDIDGVGIRHAQVRPTRPFGTRQARFQDRQEQGPTPTSYTLQHDIKPKPTTKGFGGVKQRTDLPLTSSVHTPAPAAYRPEQALQPRLQGGVFERQQTERGVRVHSEAPPATRYSLNPAVADSTYKKTFNVTIAANSINQPAARLPQARRTNAGKHTVVGTKFP
eukprot:TRINITY_DN9766_c0_g1_i5.p1 TRINITY_DN9766_c0_g1~~TRINITY_DN9766_c0_g1_i5.p1  ORF type:complete len:546 (+),score=37.44 TRINITY_DN9766_c0_g1_i5:63-1700(+)